MTHFVVMKLKTAVILLCIVTLLAACGGAMRYESELDRAEALMEERPDSALAVLESVKPADIASIESEEERARFALLYSQALDKNYIDLTSDSIISIAVEYYNNNGTPYQQFLSLFYLGRVNENAKNYLNAMRCYLKAERLVNDFDDDNLKGLLYIGIATIYRHYYDFKNTAVAFNMAYSYFDKSRKIYHRNYSRLNEAFAYSNLHEYDRSINLIKDVIDDAIADDDTIIIKSAMRSLIMIYVGQQQITQANQLYQKYISQYNFNDAGPSAIAAIALLHTFNGDTIEAKRYLKSAWCKSSTLQDTIDIYSYSERINKHSGNYTSAYDDFLRWRVRQDSYVKKSLEQPVLSAQNELLEQEIHFKEYRTSVERFIAVISVLTVILITVIIILILQRRLRNKQKTIDDSILIAEDLRNLVKRDAEILQQVSSDRISIIDNLGKDIFDLNSDTINSNTVLSNLNSVIKDLKNEDSYYKLEQGVNSCRQNIMRHLREDIPNLTEIEYRQMCFHYAGLSVKTISVLNNETTAAIYKRRTRLKTKIENSTSAYRRILLDF